MRYRISLFFFMCLTSAQATAVEFKSSAGIGLQYGGLIGWQGSMHSGDNSLRLGLGLYGATLGYEYSLFEKTSLSVQGFVIGFAQGAGVSVNHHFTTTSSPGWLLGIDLYSIESVLFSSTTTGHQERVLISVGYKF